MKTMAIRLEDDVAAQLAMLAQLEDSSIAEEIREAIALLVAHKRTLPGLADGAKRVTSEIDAETQARKAAIISLFGDEKKPSDDTSKGKAAKSG